MNGAEFLGQVERDPRLAAYAKGALPAWLWSADGIRILWANPAGATVLGAADGPGLVARIFGPADPHGRQVGGLGSRLPANGAIRMGRLRGFGAAPGGLMTCGCSRLAFADGSHGVLVVATETPSRMMPRARPGKPAPPAPAPVMPAPAQPSRPDPAPPVPTGEAPAAFALFDAFAEDDAEPAASTAPEQPDLQSVLQLDLPHIEVPPEAPPMEAAPPGA